VVGFNLNILEKERELKNLKEKYLMLFKKHEDLSKEKFVIYNRYNLVFGEKYYERYLLYFECERLRRKIELYQVYLNREEKIDKILVESLLNAEFLEYEEKLALILEEYRLAQDFDKLPALSVKDVREIKRIYLKIVKKIHPDLNPNFQNYQDLWERTLRAYKMNDLKTLQECEFILDNFIFEEKYKEPQIELDAEIAKFQQKITEIKEKNIDLINSFPYNQKHLLNNPELIQEKLEEIAIDIELFRENHAILENRIREIDPTYEKEIC